ncbi:site-specific integrase [Hahella sp. HN01]|uniref:tyrosine-type recombinase/integrase n=1 Tax=Hahella sp. HN01 TaxID=2847262 RepID=UPI001C1EDF29|nr:site-specific integrase [Hahella sp. HN01]MBU6950932.1 tyrosine-type recombinase/integrase [Hahella sp. HN01]
MGKLSDAKIRNAKTETDTCLSDGNGLSLRIYPKQGKMARTWVFRYRRPATKKPAKLTLGDYPAVSLREARQQVETIRRQLFEGFDPQHVQREQRANNANAVTVKQLFESWLALQKSAGEVADKTLAQHEGRWRVHLQKPLGLLLAKHVTRRHIAAVLDAMVEKGIKEETRKTLCLLKMMFRYAIERHHIEESPAEALSAKSFKVTSGAPRERVLSLTELRTFWSLLDREPLAFATINAFKLLILTGARRSEVANMTWSELDLTQGIWTLPPERTKNRKGHTVYLSDLAVRVIKSMRPISGYGKFVFSTGDGSAPIHTDGLSGCPGRLSAKLKGVPHFTVHDLRRSAATAWGELLKTPPHVIEKMLNHQPLDKLVATYQRATYVDEQKTAWKAWGEMVENHVANDFGNVVPLHA